MSKKFQPVTVADQQNNWTKARIVVAEFTDDHEYIRAALIKGEQSGEPRPFSSDLFKQEIVGKYGKKYS